MGKLRSWEGECLTLLWVEWGFKLEPFGPSPWDKPLCCTVCLLFTTQMMQVFTTFHEVRAERHEKGLIASGNGAHIREWSSMNAWCLGNRFPLITRNQFLSGKAIQERKGVLWAGASPYITGTSNMSQVPGWQWGCRGVQGSHTELAWMLPEVSSRHDSLRSCDLTSVLKHSISKRGLDHLQLRCETFPGMISQWHFNKYSINNNLSELPTMLEKEYIKGAWLIDAGS